MAVGNSAVKSAVNTGRGMCLCVCVYVGLGGKERERKREVKHDLWKQTLKTLISGMMGITALFVLLEILT